MANWIRLGTALDEAVAAQDAATRAERAEDAVRNAVNALTEIVATLQELADEYQTEALQVALQHALDTKDKAHEALTAAEHASLGALHAFSVTEAERYALREWARSWSDYVTPEVVDGYYARMRTIAGKIAALATKTSPDDFPHDRGPLLAGVLLRLKLKLPLPRGLLRVGRLVEFLKLRAERGGLAQRVAGSEANPNTPSPCRYRLCVGPRSRDRDCERCADEKRSMRETALRRPSPPSSARSRCGP